MSDEIIIDATVDAPLDTTTTEGQTAPDVPVDLPADTTVVEAVVEEPTPVENPIQSRLTAARLILRARGWRTPDWAGLSVDQMLKAAGMK